RAAIVSAAEDYLWSSARANLAITTDACVTPHRAFLAWGIDAKARALRYAQWLRAGIPHPELVAIRLHVRQERALGSPRFQASVARALNRPVAVRPRGRPRTRAPTPEQGHPVLGDSNE